MASCLEALLGELSSGFDMRINRKKGCKEKTIQDAVFSVFCVIENGVEFLCYRDRIVEIALAASCGAVPEEISYSVQPLYQSAQVSRLMRSDTPLGRTLGMALKARKDKKPGWIIVKVPLPCMDEAKQLIYEQTTLLPVNRRAYQTRSS